MRVRERLERTDETGHYPCPPDEVFRALSWGSRFPCCYALLRDRVGVADVNQISA